MTDLVRRALMGDREAQEECTRQGIVLPCPICSKKAGLTNDGIHAKGRNAPGSCADYHTTWRVECLWCGYKTHDYSTEFYFGRTTGEISIHGSDGKKRALTTWNTRQGPPLGRCETCSRREAEYVSETCDGEKLYDCELMYEPVSLSGFCDGYKPKEAYHETD